MRVRTSRSIWWPALLAGLGLTSPACAHLLVTEVGYDTVDETSPTSEFVELLNPDATDAPLADVWLVGDEDAYPYLVGGPVSPITLTNFIYRFPAITLGPRAIVVVCQDSDAFLAEHFGGSLAGFLAQPGQPTLLEVTPDGDADGVPGMIACAAPVSSASPSATPSLISTRASRSFRNPIWTGTCGT